MDYLPVFTILLSLLDISGGHNVVMIIADDMRAEIPAFHDPAKRPWLYKNIKTPHLQSLAQNSMVFREAFAQWPRCNPSRSSFLTSRRPDTTMVRDNDSYFRNTTRGHLITLPEYFKLSGYRTASLGKTFHTSADIDPDPPSWTERSIGYDAVYNTDHKHSWFSVPDALASLTHFGDIIVKDQALEHLETFAEDYKATGRKFFLCVGFKKPHLPFTTPEEFLEKYPSSDVEMAMVKDSPKGLPWMAWSNSDELFHYSDVQMSYRDTWTSSSHLPTEKALELRRAYYGCVSFIDDMVGHVINKVKRLNLWEDTVVVFLGDHGYHLGENGVWGKNTNLEAALHVPLMIRVPGMTMPGLTSSELVELVDIYPTIADAADLPTPTPCPSKGSDLIAFCTEGSNMMPLIKNKGKGGVTWKNRVFSQSIYPLYEHPQYMGYSVRTKQYRYTEWITYAPDGAPEDWGEPLGRELYDLESDPNQIENRADDMEMGDVIQYLSEVLHRGWADGLTTSSKKHFVDLVPVLNNLHH